MVMILNIVCCLFIYGFVSDILKYSGLDLNAKEEKIYETNGTYIPD